MAEISSIGFNAIPAGSSLDLDKITEYNGKGKSNVYSSDFPPDSRYDIGLFSLSNYGEFANQNAVILGGGGGVSGGVNVEYLMRAKDIDCGSLTYVYWNSFIDPDYTASKYDGPKCGASPLEDVIVIGISIED